MLVRGRLCSTALLAALGFLLAGRTLSSQSAGAASSSAAVASLVETGRYEAAEALAQRSFSAAGGTPEAGAAGATLVEAFVANGRGSEPRVRELTERLVRELRLSSSTSGQLATALRNLGDVWHQSGDYSRAIDALKEGLGIRERTAPGSPEVAEDLDHLAQALSDGLATDAAEYDTGVKLADRAVDTRRAMNDRTALARSLRIRGVLRKRAGDYARARTDLQESLSILEATSPVHPETARSMLHVGEQLVFDGALTKGLETMALACVMAEATLRPEHPDIADCLRRQAAAREETGDLAGAKTLRERGVAIARESLGETHPRFAVQLNDLANNFQLQNEFAPARALYEEARRGYVARLGARSNGATVTSMNLALLDARVGDYSQARQGLEQVISTWTQTLGPNHPNVARAESALASLLTIQGLHVQARRLHAAVLRVRERAYGPHHPLVARTLSNLAASVSRLGQPRQALELSARALRIWEASGSEDGLAEALVTHAEILSSNGDERAASDGYRRALEIRTRVFGAIHPLVAEGEVALAAVEARLGQIPAALDRALFGQRMAREHALLALRSLPERQALEYASTRPRGLDLAISLASSDGDRSAAMSELVLNRSLTLDEMSARRRIAADAKGVDTVSVWDELRQARQRLANLIVRGPRGNGDDYARLLDETRRQKESLERTLADRSAAFRESERRATIGLPEVRRALPPDSALVSFVRYERTAVNAAPGTQAGGTSQFGRSAVPSYAAFVLRSADDPPVLIHLGTAAAIEGAVVRWREELLAGATLDRSALASAERTLRMSGAQLRSRIWDPLASHLRGVSRVFVVPDGALNRVPIAALPAKSRGYLVEGAYVLHYLSAERDVVANQTPRAVSSRGLLALGGPAFDASGTAGRETGPAGARVRERINSTRSVTSADAADGSAPCLAFQKLRFSTLPATRREVEEVAALWDAHQLGGVRDSRTLLGPSATETTFKQLAPRQAILHLATHGFFLGDNCDSVASLPGSRAVGGVTVSSSTSKRAPQKRPAAMLDNPLVLSGLALAGANRRASTSSAEDDGILTAEEVASLDLAGVQWAVLSACDTGLGPIRGSEGVLGLPRAFQTAGARTVIMSLWPAADQATRSWMLALYRARLEKGKDTAEAVHDAALTALRARRTAAGSGHPFFWGGFVATGDWH